MTKTTIKWTKRAILILAIIPILLFLAFAGAVSLIDFNQYKPQIEKEVAELTQRDFKIEGEVAVSILPFMFHVGDMRLKNKPGFATENLMTMKEAQIELSLRALFLEKKIKVISLELIEPQLHFIKQANGDNWSDIAFLASLITPNQLASLAAQNTQQTARLRYAHHETITDDLATKVVSSTHAKSVNLGQVNEGWQLESLVIKNAQIDYSDQVQNYTISLKKANLLTFDIEPNKPFQINSDFVYEHSQSPRVFDFEINTQMLLAKHFTQLHLANWHGVFRLQLPVEQNRPDVRLTTSGDNLMIDFAQQQVFIKRAILEGLNSQVETSFTGQFGANPSFEGDFEAKEINLKSWIEHLGFPAPKMANKEALNQASGTFHWRWDGKTLELEKLDAKIDQSQVTGSLSIPLHTSAQAPLRFDLAVSDLVIEQYLLKNSVKNSPNLKVTRPGNSNKGVYPIPVAFLETAQLNGKLQLNRVTVLDKKIAHINLELTGQNGQLELAPFDVQMATGTIESKFLANLSTIQPQYVWKGRTKSLPLIELASQNNQPITGVLDSHFLLKSAGINREDWLKNLQGHLNASIAQPRVYGLNLTQILQGQVELNHQQPPFTEFDNINVIGQFSQGIFTPKRLLATAERFTATGNGELNLLSEQVKGELRITIIKPSEALAELKGLVLPLNYQGDMMKPDWSVNLAELNPKLIETSPTLSALQTLLN